MDVLWNCLARSNFYNDSRGADLVSYKAENSNKKFNSRLADNFTIEQKALQYEPSIFAEFDEIKDDEDENDDFLKEQ